MRIESLHGPWEWATKVGYAQAVRVGNQITTGGIGPHDEAGQVIEGDFEAQVRQTFRNIEAVLRTLGTDLSNVVSMNVYVTDPADYARFTAVRPEFLSAPYPASTAVGVSLLAEGMHVEMNAVAIIGAARQPVSL